MTIEKKSEAYQARITAVGALWGGGTGFVKIESIDGPTALAIHEKGVKLFDAPHIKGTGDLEGVSGLILDVERIIDITVDGKVYSRVETLEPDFIGNVTQKQMDYFFDSLYE
jgi:deoxyhypusine synthase